MAEGDQNSNIDTFASTDEQKNTTSKSIILIDGNILKENIPKPPSYFKRRFLLRSFTFLFFFNFFLFISVFLFIRYNINFYNEIASYIFIGLIIIFSFIAQIKPFWFISNSTFSIIITILYFLSILGFSLFFLYPIIPCFFLGVLLANNVLFILIALLPYSKKNKILMIISNIIIMIPAIIHIFKPFLNQDIFILFFPAFILVLCHSISASAKAEAIEDDDYNYYISQVYIMFELAIILFYLLIFALAVFCCLLNCLCRTCSTYEPYKDENGNTVYLTHWGDHLEDMYGNRYSARDDSWCNIF